MTKCWQWIALLSILTSAQTNVALSGKLIDTQGNPIPDIEIELSSLGLRDTTDGTGQWSINANTPIRNIGTALPLDAQFSGNDLYLSLAQSAKVRIEISDIAGQRTSILGEQALAAGKHQIELGQKLPYGTYFLRVWAGQLSRTFRVQYSSLDNQMHASEQGAATITDKLVYRFQGQFLTEDQISKYEQYIEKFLQIRNISGQFTPGTTTIQKVSAWLSGSSMALPISLKLGWIPQTNSYSGKAYSVKPLGSDLFDYKIFAFALDSLGHRSTQTDTLHFNSEVGDLSLPATQSGNALPKFSVNVPVRVAIGDSIPLDLKVWDTLGGQVLIAEGRFGTNSWVNLLSDRLISPPLLLASDLPWQVRIMDNDSNWVYGNGKAQIINNAPSVDAGPDIILYQTDSITLRGNANDSMRSIVHRDWKIDNGPWMAVTDSLRIQIDSSVTCYFRATNTDSVSSIDSLRVQYSMNLSGQALSRFGTYFPGVLVKVINNGQLLAQGQSDATGHWNILGSRTHWQNDTLIYMMEDQIITKQPLSSWNKTDYELRILGRSISGNLGLPTDSSRIALGVFALLSGGELGEIRQVFLDYLAVNRNYTGILYTLDDGISRNYSVETWAFDSSHHKIGRSSILGFSGTNANLQMTSFIADNAIPTGSIVAPDTLGWNKAAQLKSIASDAFGGKILSYEWDLGTGKFVAGDSMAMFQTTKLGKYKIRSRIMDNDSNWVTLAPDSIVVINAKAKVGGLPTGDTTLTPSDTLTLNLNITDPEKVNYVKWNFSGAQRDSVLFNKDTANPKIVFITPSTTAIPLGQSQTITLTLTLIDQVGDSTVLSRKIIVENDKPKILSMSSDSSILRVGRSYNTQSTVYDRSSRISFQYKINNVIQTGKTTSLLNWTPKDSTEYKVDLIVTDDDNNKDSASFVFNGFGGTFTDTRDSKSYKWVRAGKQDWMAENLNYGTQISILQDQSNPGIAEKYCPKDTAKYCTSNGGLYQWTEAMQVLPICSGMDCTDSIKTPFHKGICPSGWHLPTDSEWNTLRTFADSLTSTPNDAAKVLFVKTIMFIGKDFGLNLLNLKFQTSGFRSDSATYRLDTYDSNTFFWALLNQTTKNASFRYLGSDSYDLVPSTQIFDNTKYTKKSAFSVRCVRDTLFWQ